MSSWSRDSRSGTGYGAVSAWTAIEEAQHAGALTKERDGAAKAAGGGASNGCSGAGCAKPSSKSPKSSPSLPSSKSSKSSPNSLSSVAKCPKLALLGPAELGVASPRLRENDDFRLDRADMDLFNDGVIGESM